MTTLLIALAGGLGSAARFVVDAVVTGRVGSRIPWGVVVVNLTGSFAIGVVAGSTSGLTETVVATGFLGGYTTFSTAMVDVVELARVGAYRHAVATALGTLALSVGAVLVGLALAAAL